MVDRVLPDPRIAKVILTRNPLDSYVSRKIATATGQWRLTDAKNRKSAQIRFDAEEFAELTDRLAAFQDRLRRGLQLGGQGAFLIRYEDINDADVLNGLAAFLGSEGRIDTASTTLKRQNPGDLSEKVENYDEMIAALRDVDRFGLTASPRGGARPRCGSARFRRASGGGAAVPADQGCAGTGGDRLDGRDRRRRARGPLAEDDAEGPEAVDEGSSGLSQFSRCCGTR